MKTKKQDIPLDLEALTSQTRAIAEPVDMDQLVADGVLRKAGTWYEVLCHPLPDALAAKVRSAKSKNGKMFLQFSSGAGARKLLNRLGHVEMLKNKR